MPHQGGGRYVFDHALSAAHEEFVTAQLVAYNRANSTALDVPHLPAEALQVTILGADAQVIGGLIGRTHVIPQWLEITVIWVSAQLRGQGLGARLMTEAETEARQRGCRFARAATSNFQAPGFYVKLGYRRYGRLQDCPPGETVSYYWKPL